MQNSADTASTSRPVIIYIIVAVVLFAALLLGVRWAKSRADYYAQQQTGSSNSQTASNNGQSQTENPPQGASSQNQPSTSQPSSSATGSQNSTQSTPTVAATGPAAPARVPSTGPEQVFLTLVSLSAAAFAGASYVRARRRLQQLAQ